MGVFEFVLLIVSITTVGKVLEARASRPSAPPKNPVARDPLEIDEAMADLHRRLERLEEERDFYRALLEAPASGGDADPTLPS